MPWAILDQQGVAAAHCTCMAGYDVIDVWYFCVIVEYNYYVYRLGETCSHVAAILSCVVEAVEARKAQGSSSCTSQKCTWLSSARNVRCCCYANHVITL